MPGSGVAHEPSYPSPRRWVVYTAAGLLMVGVLIALLVGANTRQNNQDAAVAQQRAATLQDHLREAGLTPPKTTVLTQVFGSDGGAVCANAGEDLARGVDVSGRVNGAGGPGLRPSITADRLVQAERLVIKVYCPDKSAEFETYVDSLNLDDLTTLSGD
jgi:hypothetical protein